MAEYGQQAKQVEAGRLLDRWYDQYRLIRGSTNASADMKSQHSDREKTGGPGAAGLLTATDKQT